MNIVNKLGNSTQKKRRSQDDGLVKVSAIQEMTRVLQHNASRIATRDNYGSLETISLQEMIARAIMRNGLDALMALQGRQDGDELKPLQPMISTGMFMPPAMQHAHSVERPIHAIVNDKEGKGSKGPLTLEKDEPLLEKEVKQAISDSYVYFIEDIARKVENGEIKKPEQV